MTWLAVILAGITALVLVALARPLLRRPRQAADPAEFDRAVYRDQLQELQRDVGRGLISAEESRIAAMEIQRRLLATDTISPARGAPRRSPILAASICVLVAGSSAWFYLRVGNPGLPDLAFASRSLPAATDASVADAGAHGDTKAAAERLAAKLKLDPSNGENWLLYARTESMLNDWDKALDGYRHAIALGETDGGVYAGFGEMLVMAAGGIVSPAAQDAFKDSVKSEPGNEVARFYLALADGQAGESEKAIAAWRSLAGDLDAASPIRAEIGRRMAEAAGQAGLPVPELPKPREAAPEATTATSAPGPTHEQMKAAESMSEEERNKMVESMTARLAAQLKANPNDAEGWLRLGRAYVVKGQHELAADAFVSAARLRGNDADLMLQAVAALLAPVKEDAPLPARAVALLREVAVIRPASPEVLWYLGVVAARDGRKDEARREWSQLLPILAPGGEDYKMVQAALSGLNAP